MPHLHILMHRIWHSISALCYRRSQLVPRVNDRVAAIKAINHPSAAIKIINHPSAAIKAAQFSNLPPIPVISKHEDGIPFTVSSVQRSTRNLLAKTKPVQRAILELPNVTMRSKNKKERHHKYQRRNRRLIATQRCSKEESGAFKKNPNSNKNKVSKVLVTKAKGWRKTTTRWKQRRRGKRARPESMVTAPSKRMKRMRRVSGIRRKRDGNKNAVKVKDEEKIPKRKLKIVGKRQPRRQSQRLKMKTKNKENVSTHNQDVVRKKRKVKHNVPRKVLYTLGPKSGQNLMYPGVGSLCSTSAQA